MHMEKIMPSPSSQLIKNHTVHASAGAGKTTRLITEVMNSIQSYREKHDEDFPNIIVTTFTRNATYEVKERIIATAVKQEDWKLVHAIHESNQIFVSTLHGILYAFLRKHFSDRFGQSIVMNKLQVKMGARFILRDIMEDSSFLPLLRYYKFNELCEFMTDKYMDHIHIEPTFRPMTQKEMSKEWCEEISKFSIPFEVSTKNIKDAKFFLEQQVSEKKIKKEEIKSFFKTHHPQYYEEMENQYQLFYKSVQIFEQKWDEYKKRKSWMQIGDLESEVLKMIKNKSPELSSFSQNYSEWFIDEYQDISPAQELILQHFTSKAQKVWVVGDPQQSIYLFRKADPEVFNRRIHIKNGTLEKKHCNYRSTPQIISFFNDLFKNKFEPMTSQRDSEDSLTPSVYFLIYPSETSALSKRLNQLFEKNVQPQSICVLCKDNKDVQQISYHLKKLGFPVQSHSKKSLKREILDSLFLLRFLSTPWDNQNLIGLLRTPYFYMADSQIAQYINKQESLWNNLIQKNKEDSVVESLNHLLQKAQTEGFSHALSDAFENHFMIDLCYIQDPTREKEKNLWNFLLDLKRKEESFDFRITQFIEEKTIQPEDYEIDSGGSSCKTLNFVQVMTIHQSKGLEFDHVIISQTHQELVPPDTDRFIMNTRDLLWSFSIYDENGEPVTPIQQKKFKELKKEESFSEQDRLLYVACTRAKNTLTFMIDQSFWNEWSKKKSKNHWLKRFSYFDQIYREYDLSHQQTMNREKYNIEIQNIESTSSSPCLIHKEEKGSVVSPFSYKKNSPQKSIEASALTSPPISMSQKIESSHKGTELHLIMNKIQQQGDVDTVLKNLDQKNYWKPICDYIFNIKTIPIKEIMKNGFSEWGFIYNTKEYQIKGVMDLWGIVNETLWIVDYKSSEKISKEYWTQLGLYSFALKKKHPQKEIKMCILQPMVQKYHIQSADQNFLNEIQKFIEEYK